MSPAIRITARKWCGCCERKLHIKAFGKNKSRPDGVQPYCRICTRKAWAACRVKAWSKYRKTEDRSFTKYYATKHGKAMFRLNSARRKSRIAGLAFDLTPAWLEKKFAVGVCEATGLPFSWDVHHGRGHRLNSFAPSLDRINQNLGYTKRNTRVVVWIFNRSRGAFPDEDLMVMARALVKREASAC